MAATGKLWRSEETKALLSIWLDATIQQELNACKKNSAVYVEISEKLDQQFGFERAPQQCRSKIKALKSEYKKCVDHNRRSGRGRKSFPFFEELDSILGNKPAVNPPHLLESVNNDNEDDSPETGLMEASSLTDDAENDDADNDYAGNDNAGNDNEPENGEEADDEDVDNNQTRSQDIDTQGNEPARKKAKKTKWEQKMESTSKALATALGGTMQKQQDRFAELEAKRQEEAQRSERERLRMELEHEARMREADRAHEAKMMSTFMTMFTRFATPPNMGFSQSTPGNMQFQAPMMFQDSQANQQYAHEPTASTSFSAMLHEEQDITDEPDFEQL